MFNQGGFFTDERMKKSPFFGGQIGSCQIDPGQRKEFLLSIRKRRRFRPHHCLNAGGEDKAMFLIV